MCQAGYLVPGTEVTKTWFPAPRAETDKDAIMRAQRDRPCWNRVNKVTRAHTESSWQSAGRLPRGDWQEPEVTLERGYKE